MRIGLFWLEIEIPRLAVGESQLSCVKITSSAIRQVEVISPGAELANACDSYVDCFQAVTTSL